MNFAYWLEYREAGDAIHNMVEGLLAEGVDIHSEYDKAINSLIKQFKADLLFDEVILPGKTGDRLKDVIDAKISKIMRSAYNDEKKDPWYARAASGFRPSPMQLIFTQGVPQKYFSSDEKRKSVNTAEGESYKSAVGKIAMYLKTLIDRFIAEFVSANKDQVKVNKKLDGDIRDKFVNGLEAYIDRFGTTAIALAASAINKTYGDIAVPREEKDIKRSGLGELMQQRRQVMSYRRR